MRSLLTLLALCSCSVLIAQNNNFWKSINESSIALGEENDRGLIPEHYQTFSLDLEGIKSYLEDAPMHRTPEAENNPLLLELPMPDGEMQRFKVVESPVMSPVLSAKYPSIIAFKGVGINDKSWSVRFDISPKGFHAAISTSKGTVYVDPFSHSNTKNYITYFTKDLAAPENYHFTCGTEIDKDILTISKSGLVRSDPIQRTATVSEGEVELRTYRLAVACTGEYAQYHGGTTELALAAINTVVNRINEIFERDLAIKFILVDNNDEIIFLDPETDGYTNGDFGAIASENPGIINPIIGFSNYDIGHVLGTAQTFGGTAGDIGTVCRDDFIKAGASSTMNNPINDPFVVNIVAHEIGHQFGGLHSFSSCHNITPQTSYEPGGGTTIMSYAGICGLPINNLQDNSDDYFHVNSLQLIRSYSRLQDGNICPELAPTGNHEPQALIPYEDGFFIPKSTPFELTGIGNDLDNDSLSYVWEQYDLDVSNLNSPPGSPQGNSPLFRSIHPSDSPTRVFPYMAQIVNNISSTAEVLPDYGRDLTFRFTVRDNNPAGGGTDWEELSFHVSDTAGPFQVLFPNQLMSFEVGQYIDVEWNVANTDSSEVNCKFVNIKLSLDGGFTYPITLVEDVPNTGIRTIYLPDQITTTARIRVEAANNIFFDISNQNFEIIPASSPGFAMAPSPYLQTICTPGSAIVDLNMISTLGYDSLVQIIVSEDPLPEGAEVTYSSNPVSPLESGTIQVSTENIEVEGIFPIEIASISSEGDTLNWTVYFEVIQNDLSDVLPLEPENGSSGVEEVPTFTWQASPNANSYEIEIATSPSFAPETIVESAQGVIGSSFNPSVQLEQNTLHFWRIRPENECGFGHYSLPQGFYTEIFSCNTFVSEDIPINISGIGTPTIESILVIDSDITINDLNVLKIKGSHDLVKHLDVSLISPDETEVLLFSNKCGVATAFDFGLDDEAPSEIAQCFNAVYQPQEMLSAFDGTSSIGTWTLRVAVNNPDGTGGTLQAWSLELCSNASASPPFLVTNETMAVAPGEGRLITDDFLLSQDNDNGPSELTYTIVTAPEYGTILFQNEPVEVGMTFRQSSINAGNVKYMHDGGPDMEDGFTFAVEDGEGGWFGTPLFEILIDPNVIVGTEELGKKNSFSVFPNPAQDRLYLQFEQAVSGSLEVSITNISGQLLKKLEFENVLDQAELSSSALSDGIYFIRVETETGVDTEKVIIQQK